MNEVVIFSSEFDYSTDRVINWLLFFRNRVIRINHENTTIQSLSSHESIFKETCIHLKCNNKIQLKDVSSVWFKGSRLIAYVYNEKFVEDTRTNDDINDKITNESRILSELINTAFSDKKSLGDFVNFGVNKLLTLKAARKVDLNVPDTFVVNNKKDLENILCKHDKIACKAIYEAIRLKLNEESFLCYTQIINKENIQEIPKEFNYTCFQEYVEKKYEIRTFFINGEFYSMAIFSQENNQTKTDFRQYDFDNPNRCIPFQLPIEIENNLSKLMKRLQLNTGSIDLIYSIDSKFYFLEVNPVGQYDFVSKSCNYYLDKKIATYLSYYEE